MTDYIVIGPVELVISAALILVNIVLSVALRLGMGKRLVVASVRMTVQLLLVGLVLAWVFALKNPWVIGGLALLMAGLASVAAVRRTSRRFAGIYWDSLVSILGASFVVTGFGLFWVVGTDPWYEPQYLIPLLGMVLGNTLNGISLGLDRFMQGVVERRTAIEARLCLGATRWEAAHAEVTEALRTGMIPIVNSMMIMGIVSLPGMMTGQILAGADPVQAVHYQILIVFMIASAVALGTFGVVVGAFFRLFTSRHQLRVDRLEKVET